MNKRFKNSQIQGNQTIITDFFKLSTNTHQVQTKAAEVSKNSLLTKNNFENSFKCEKCSKNFKTKSNLKSHLRLVHTKFVNESSYSGNKVKRLEEIPSGYVQCEYCNNTYKSAQFLIQHKKKVHKVCPDTLSKNTKYFCSPCNMHFTRKDNLQRHKLTNAHKSKLSRKDQNQNLISGYKYICRENDCNERFRDSFDLKRHMDRNHKSNEVIYKLEEHITLIPNFGDIYQEMYLTEQKSSNQDIYCYACGNYCADKLELHLNSCINANKDNEEILNTKEEIEEIFYDSLEGRYSRFKYINEKLNPNLLQIFNLVLNHIFKFNHESNQFDLALFIFFLIIEGFRPGIKNGFFNIKKENINVLYEDLLILSFDCKGHKINQKFKFENIFLLNKIKSKLLLISDNELFFLTKTENFYSRLSLVYSYCNSLLSDLSPRYFRILKACAEFQNSLNFLSNSINNEFDALNITTKLKLSLRNNTKLQPDLIVRKLMQNASLQLCHSYWRNSLYYIDDRLFVNLFRKYMNTNEETLLYKHLYKSVYKQNDLLLNTVWNDKLVEYDLSLFKFNFLDNSHINNLINI